MALVSMRQVLDHAAENGYGVPAFNVNNLEQMRANIYGMFRVNDCLLGYPGFEVNLTHTQGNQIVPFEISGTGHKLAFFPPQYMDFAKTRDKRDWARGVFIPYRWLNYLLLADGFLTKLTATYDESRSGGFVFEERSASEIGRREKELKLDVQNRVRFASKNQVRFFDKDEKIAKGAEVKGADDTGDVPVPKTKSEKKDNENLWLIGSSIAAFFGIYFLALDS